MEDGLQEIMRQAGRLIAGGCLREKQDGFAGGYPLYINTGVAARELNAEFSAGIPKRNIVMLESDLRDLVHRYYCQKNSVFFFSKISSAYKELLYKLAWSVLGEDVTDKVLRSAFKRAERGK